MIRSGRITAVNAVAGSASVRLHAVGPDGVTACSLCARGLGCQVLYGRTDRAPLLLDCRLPAQPGAPGAHDARELASLLGCEVRVRVPDGYAGGEVQALRAVVIGYGVPALALVLGCLVGDHLAALPPSFPSPTAPPGGVGAQAIGSALPATIGGLCGLLLGVLASAGSLRARAALTQARPCHDAARIVSVATTRPPAPADTP